VRYEEGSEMALETLVGMDSIGGFKIVRKRGDLSWDEFDEKRKEFPINITEEKNMISFKIQDGPVKENGVNGCQVDTLIHTALVMVTRLDDKFPCVENKVAMDHLFRAMQSLNARKSDREARGVEGRSEL
jgi:hypothetical protein